MRTKNKNVTQVDSGSFFISLFKIGRTELKISYKLVLDLHSHILKKRKEKKTDTSVLEKLVKRNMLLKRSVGLERIGCCKSQRQHYLYQALYKYTSSSNTFNQIVTYSSIISSMTQMTRRRTLGEE